MATIDNATARLASTLANTDIMYVGSPNDSNADRKITIAEIKKLFTPQTIIMDVSRSESANVSAATDVYTFDMPFAFTITEVIATVVTAPVGADIEIDVREGATSIFDGSNVLVIDDGETSSTTSGSPASISDTTIAENATVSIDVDQVGSSTAGAGLKVFLVGYLS